MSTSLPLNGACSGEANAALISGLTVRFAMASGAWLCVSRSATTWRVRPRHAARALRRYAARIASLIRRPEDLTADWLTAALGVPVRGFETTRIGTGQMSE